MFKRRAHKRPALSLTAALCCVTVLAIGYLGGCDDTPSACKSDEDCREGFVCDQEIYKGECVQAVQVIRCGERLCQYPPEICVRDTCVVMGERDALPPSPPLEPQDASPPEWDQRPPLSDAEVRDMSLDFSASEDIGTRDQEPPGDQRPPEDIGPGGPDQGGEPCVSACDCVPGLACQAGRCASLNEPVYCCSGDFCPPEASCETLEGRLEICAPTTCTSACDCSPGMRCEGGACVIGDTPLFCCNAGPCPAGADCETPSQRLLTCASDSCTSACDCPTGQSCEGGSCVSTSPAVFCCTEGLCPAGQLCETPAGQRATCEGGSSCVSACDCTPGRSCLGGVCTVGIEPVYCCDDAESCPADATCQPREGGRFELCP